MRMSMIAASALALFAADAASAQRMVMPGPGVGAGMGPGRAPGMMQGRPGGAQGARWGSNVGGHWWGGVNAPGGWHSYRRPVRGWNLPSYWVSPSFAIGDWSTYGLGAPPAGYGWTRYYDDAVLTDGNGRIYDSVSGVDWSCADSASGDVAYSSGPAYPAPGMVQSTYGQSTYSPAPAYAPAYPQPGYAPGAGYAPPPAYAERRNSGVGGALVGAGVGAVAGNLIGGRGHRLEGTLIGAGVGGVAGYAIDRSQTHRVPVAPRGDYPYPPQGYAPGAGYAPPPPPPPPPGRAGVWHSPDGGTTITTTSVGGYAGGSTTVVTVQTAPVVTTTTTEIVEDRVTYTRARHAVRHKWVRRPRCGC